jgi:prepilin-type N-terminal cleavage/methylation domain-containing protein
MSLRSFAKRQSAGRVSAGRVSAGRDSAGRDSAGGLSAGRLSTGFTRAGGFTLVELLIVIAIIVVLISILLPAISAARQQAVSINCLSNLRGIGQLMTTYAADNLGEFPGTQGVAVAPGNATYAESDNYIFSNMVNVNGASLPAGSGNGGPTSFGVLIANGYLSMSQSGLRVLYCPGRDPTDRFSYESCVGFDGYPANPSAWPVVPAMSGDANAQPFGFLTRQAHWDAYIGYNVLNSNQGACWDATHGYSIYYNHSRWGRLGSVHSDSPLAYEVFGWSSSTTDETWLNTNHGKGYNVMLIDGSAQFYADPQNVLGASFRCNGFATYTNHMGFAGSDWSNSSTENNRFDPGPPTTPLPSEFTSGLAYIEQNFLNWGSGRINTNMP